MLPRSPRPPNRKPAPLPLFPVGVESARRNDPRPQNHKLTVVGKNAHPQRPGGADVPAGQYPPLPPHVSAAKDSPLFARFPLFPYWDRESTSP